MDDAVFPDDRIWSRRAAQSLVALMLLLSTAAFLGRLVNLPQLASFGAGKIPMAPLTSICFATLGTALLLAMRPVATTVAHYLGALGAVLVTLCGLVVWVSEFDTEKIGPAAIHAAGTEDFNVNALSQMSPVTGALFALAGLALAWTLVSRARSADPKPWVLPTAAVGGVVAAAATFIGISYAAAAPLFYDGTTLPMALPTAIAFALLGCGLLAMAVSCAPRPIRWRGRLADVPIAMQLRLGLGGIVFAVFGLGYVVHLQSNVLWAQTTALYEQSFVDTGRTAEIKAHTWQLYAEAERRNDALESAVIALFAAVVLASTLVGWLLNRQVSSRVRELTSVAAQFAQGKHDVRSASGSANELGTLASTFNAMADTIQAQLQSTVLLTEQLRRSETSLSAQNKELEAFSYSVSHDLRAPLRSIDGFSRILLEDHDASLDAEGRDCLQRIREAARNMAQLIDDLLRLSRLSRGELVYESVDLSAMVREIAAELVEQNPERHPALVVANGVVAHGDRRLLRVALGNLIGNAFKFTSTRVDARVEFGVITDDEHRYYFVRDNGVGFDPQYADKLFGAFQRLHGKGEFPGTGIGLATVQRVIRRHGGRVWAEGAVNQGATFSFDLATQPIES